MFTGFASGLLGAVGGILASRSARSSIADANAANERLSWDMWHATNRYNHPKNQMARFREAGLNPNLIYGQMNNVAPPAFVRSAPVPGIDFGMDKIADAMQNSESMELQRASLEQNAALSEAGLMMQAQKMSNDLDIRNRELNLQEALLPYKIDQIIAGNELSRLQSDLIRNPEKRTPGMVSDAITTMKNKDAPWYSRAWANAVYYGDKFLNLVGPYAKSAFNAYVGSKFLKGAKFSFR